MESVTLTRRPGRHQTVPKTMVEWATGRHMPSPSQSADGRWYCRDCGLLLTRYRKGTTVRLRHHPRRKAA